jgi:hypothetical protein
MKHNDLSNKVSPRILLVAEDALIFQRQKPKKKASPVDGWVLHEMMVRQILWLFHKKDVNIEVVTYLGDEFGEALAEWLDDEGVPVAKVWSTTPGALARNIAYMPDLAAVYDANAERWLSYGSFGRYLERVQDFGDF